MNWSGRRFPMCAEQRVHSESSKVGCGGVDSVSRKIVHEFWRGSDEHINIKELIAAMQTVKATPGKTVEFSVDNAVIYWYLRKGGGRREKFNALLRPFWRLAAEQQSRAATK